MNADLRSYARLVALPHSVFALPFALASFLLAAAVRDGTPAVVRPSFWVLFLLVVCLIAARTAAMAFNRLIDADLDLRNPRTSKRELPSGKLTRGSVAKLVLFSSIVFIGSTGLLGVHCLLAAPIILAVLFGYSYTKRFSTWSHLVLGFALSLAPGGAWWVLRPQVEATPVLLMLAVMLWVSGFDVLYSLQDKAFDRKEGLFSIPAKFGLSTALVLARLMHCACFVALLLTGVSAGLEEIYYIGVCLLAVPLVWQHLLISSEDLSRINNAFFTANGLISIGYFMIVVLSSVVHF